MIFTISALKTYVEIWSDKKTLVPFLVLVGGLAAVTGLGWWLIAVLNRRR